MDDLLQSAITKMRVKLHPVSVPDTPKVFTQEDAHKSLFPILELWDAEREDPDIDNKVKFIHEFLTDERGTARDKIMSILNELPPISNDKTVDRIYKHCRLKNEYRKTVLRAEMLNQRLRKI